MSPTLPIIAAPDAEAWAWANLKATRGLTSFSYTAQQIDRAGWLTSVFVQVDARAARRTPAREAAEEARRVLLGLPTVDWADGVVCMVAVVEAPFWLPDDDGQPRYVARYEIRVHPRRGNVRPPDNAPSPPATGRHNPEEHLA